jgi:hypothetical protein
MKRAEDDMPSRAPRTRIALSVLALAAVGCQAAPPATPAGRTSAPAARATRSPATDPAPAATGTPAPIATGTAATPTPAGAPTTAPSPAGSPAAFKLPTRLVPPLPASLVAAAGLVGADGASLIGADAGTYVLRQAGPPSLATMIRDQVSIYLLTTVFVQQVFLVASVAALQPGAKVTFVDEDNPKLTAEEKQRPENKLTVALRPTATFPIVEIFRGPEADPARRLAAVSFSSLTTGRLLMHDPAPQADGTSAWVAAAFDLAAQRSDADLYLEGPAGVRTRAQIAFVATPGAPAGTPTFTMRTTAYGVNPAKDEDGVLSVSANFRDEGAAAIVGVLPKKFAATLAGNLVFMPSDGSEPEPSNAKPHALFLDARGRDLAPSAATAALTALVPPDADVRRPFAPDPTVPKDRAPLDEAVFRFPE